ncbi:MAG: 16S rRNA (guanine(527)-N(7))-methyltransferase RsmG [Alphaproteobacteria bacterium HGW-Alphaproteobacteria-8]|nr:MAG: 16S rRNA (guanine(527)-N(7))-methyltransferase RsmG [Alphaproteobacteria bacterium HGW-Alphaproteobacteria-8]
MADGRERFLHDCVVSRETVERLDALVAILEEWNNTINLVSRASLSDVWIRHILDCAQLYPLAPTDAKTWIDLGSGGGFPGLVIAALANEKNPSLHMTLVESDSRKCAFLASAALRMGLNVTTENRRIEGHGRRRFDVVSARALARLPALLALAEPYMNSDSVALFLKGSGADRELTEVLETRHVSAMRIPSITDPNGVILAIKGASRAKSGS